VANLLSSCSRIEEEISFDPELRLTLSSDTIQFDTVLTSVGSITRRFKIFNQNAHAIEIETLYLGRGANSHYTVFVNGAEGFVFSNEVIQGNDSLLVLIEVLIDPADQDLPFLVKDSLVLDYNGNTDHVKLVAWGQDAVFLNQETIACDEIWTAGKPYVIYGFALVDTLCTLTVEKGVKILIDNDASLFVKGSLQINGAEDQKVIIRNTRLDPGFEIAPGQWDGIYFLEGSFDNRIDHAIIRNGQVGLRVGTPDMDSNYDLRVSNTSIGHMSVSGILSFTSDIHAWNVEIFNCRQYLVGNFAGGNYQYQHCTFSNYINLFARQDASFQVSDNIVLADGTLLTSDLNIEMTNCIIWGSEPEELLISESGQTSNTIVLSSNIIRSSNTDLENGGNIISVAENFPGFVEPLLFDYQIDSLSNARDIGVDLGILYDILGTERDAEPDIGAYERKDSIP